MQFDIDRQGEEDLDDAFEEFLKRCGRRFEEAKERLAETGEKPMMVLFGVDRENRRISIVPVDPPTPE